MRSIIGKQSEACCHVLVEANNSMRSAPRQTVKVLIHRKQDGKQNSDVSHALFTPEGEAVMKVPRLEPT